MYNYSASQFGFISGRSTQMATAVAHDVGSYCTARGSPLFYCSLDAEGAFDFLPIVLFYRSPWKLSQTKYGYCCTIGIRT